MSQSEETLDSDTTPTGSGFHLGLQSPDPDPDPTPIPDISPHDFNHSSLETEHEEINLEQQLQNLDLKEETEGEGKEKQEEAEEKDDGDRESDNYADGNLSGDEDNEGGEERNDDEVNGENVRRNEGKGSHYPVRPEAEDCAYYMKTGLCKFSYNCKFNHPLRRKNQAVKEKVKEKDESMEKPSQTECKYYLRTGGCKFGKACRYNHTTVKSSAGQILELNFLGLPIRQGERECPYYMRNGSCKYGTNCRFNHPDPTTTGVCDQPSGYGNGGSVSSQAAPQVNMVTWSSPRALNEIAAYMPVMFPPPHVVSQPNLEWNGYQTPVYPLERSLHATPAYVMNKPGTETAAYTHYQPQTVADEFPARPGQPECSYFLRTGDCKFKSDCKYHHPRNRVAKPTPFTLSDKGLPLRPDQTICSHYSRYGICKFGPACKFDHSNQEAPSTMSGLDDQPPTFSHSAATEQTGVACATGTTVQQLV